MCEKELSRAAIVAIAFVTGCCGNSIATLFPDSQGGLDVSVTIPEGTNELTIVFATFRPLRTIWEIQSRQTLESPSRTLKIRFGTVPSGMNQTFPANPQEAPLLLNNIEEGADILVQVSVPACVFGVERRSMVLRKVEGRFVEISRDK